MKQTWVEMVMWDLSDDNKLFEFCPKYDKKLLDYPIYCVKKGLRKKEEVETSLEEGKILSYIKHP